ncbi:hypothetical protein KSP40_PGU010526 [Platanthera guangdongensis]|uniref:Uncharacterized protein n=1 Tax=Platanthera guangdongensis TaxID=2320717 RepID=A0ABR2MRV9_9ASPA
MERHIILSDLKQKRLLPDSWIEKFPKQSVILQRLMSPSSADRPSATDLLHQNLLPRMKDEWLNKIYSFGSPEMHYIVSMKNTTTKTTEPIYSPINGDMSRGRLETGLTFGAMHKVASLRVERPNL